MSSLPVAVDGEVAADATIVAMCRATLAASSSVRTERL
jgi:hypothetical protein